MATEWLLLEESGWKFGKEVVVNMARTNHLTVQIEFDFYGVDTVELNAIIDSGLQVCFPNRSILSQFTASLLHSLIPCPIRFSGISGTSFLADGVIHLDCKIAGRIVNQHFVVANITENVLLGLYDKTLYQLGLHARYGEV